MRALILASALGVFVLGCARSPTPQRHEAPPTGAQPVTFPGLDGVTLHGFFYLPAGAGPFPAVLWNHGSEKWPGWQPELAAFYNGNGFAFFIPHRRGQGRSSDAGAYIMDRQPSKLQVVANGTAAGQAVIALHEEAARDVDAALAWLRTRPEIDGHRIVMSGVSFGGIQTMLAAEKDQGVRAFAAFAPGAISWRWVTGLDARLAATAQNARAPVLVLQAQNDFDLGPSRVLGPILERAGKGRALTFPAFGTTEREGHGAFACTTAGTAIWGPAVLAFFRGVLGPG